MNEYPLVAIVMWFLAQLRGVHVGTRAYDTSKLVTNGMRERWWSSEVVGVFFNWPEWFPSDSA